MLPLVHLVLPVFMASKRADRQSVVYCVRQGMSSFCVFGLNFSLSSHNFVLLHHRKSCRAFCPPGSAAPSPCAPGSFSTAISRISSCTSLCGVGKFSKEGATACRDCYGGTIATYVGTAHCEQCPEGILRDFVFHTYTHVYIHLFV